jgi:hypothetical protein
LCKVQTVGFEKLANAFDSKALPESSLRRIQRFIANFVLESDLVAKLIFGLLPQKENLKLSIDRTNWKFGKTDINIFMLGVTYKGVAFPLMFTMLNKRGNSNCQERIDLLNRFITLFGSQCIDCLMADREFVGDEWIQYLNANHIRYYIRIRNNFKIFIPHKNEEIKAAWLFQSLKFGEFMHYKKIVRMGTQLCYISGCKQKGKSKDEELLMIVSFNKPEQAQLNYQKRWQIETCFRAMKSSGFDMEKTHLHNIYRIEKLTLLVMIAFVWCYKTGIFIHENIKKIKRKKALIILDKLRDVQELAIELSPYFKGYTIYQSTGYVSKTENHSEKIRAANLIIATNKAEVGVNYDVEYCIMEIGKHFQNFIQRFGRVSRGDLPGKVIIAIDKYSKYKRIFNKRTQYDYYDFLELMRLQMQQRAFYTKKVPMYIGEYIWCIENNIRRFQDFSVWQYLKRRMSEEGTFQSKFYSRYWLMKSIDEKIQEMIKYHLGLKSLSKNEQNIKRQKIYFKLEKNTPRTFEWVTWWNNYLDTYLTFRDGSKVVKIIDTTNNEELEYSLDWIIQHKEVLKIETIQNEKYEILIYTVGKLKERNKDIEYIVSTLPNARMSRNNILTHKDIYELEKVFKLSVGRIYDKVKKGIDRKDELQVELCQLIKELHRTFDRKRLKIESIDNDDCIL